jgi:hypothetical protein
MSYEKGLRLTFEVLRAIFCEPGLESVQKRNCVLNVLIGGLMIALLHVLREVFEFGPVLHIHRFKATSSRRPMAREVTLRVSP